MGTVHFRIGEDMGILLATIAQEHLIYDNDPIKALKAITDSLCGCPTEIAVKILTGELVLPVDVETQQVICQPRIPNIHDGIYPKIDVFELMAKLRRDVVNNGRQLRTGLLMLQNNTNKTDGHFVFGFEYGTIFQFIAGNDEALLRELREDREYQAIEGLIITTKDYITKTMKIQNLMEWLYMTFNEYNEDINALEYLEIKGDVSEMLSTIMQLLQETLRVELKNFKAEDLSIQQYIEAQQEIDAVVEEGIKPVNILDNWSAGWLAPNGDFYGLNGEIANMLHQQIADCFLEAGIIPENYKDDEYGHAVNPDAWLEQQGWVKIHGSNINYGGCLNTKTHMNGKIPNVNMTDIQIKKIYEYGQLCCQGMLKMGWRRERLSAARFQMDVHDDILAFNKKYFEF
jgi:hypothetical protein